MKNWPSWLKCTCAYCNLGALVSDIIRIISIHRRGEQSDSITSGMTLTLSTLGCRVRTSESTLEKDRINQSSAIKVQVGDPAAYRGIKGPKPWNQAHHVHHAFRTAQVGPGYTRNSSLVRKPVQFKSFAARPWNYFSNVTESFPWRLLYEDRSQHHFTVQ